MHVNPWQEVYNSTTIKYMAKAETTRPSTASEKEGTNACNHNYDNIDISVLNL